MIYEYNCNLDCWGQQPDNFSPHISDNCLVKNFSRSSNQCPCEECIVRINCSRKCKKREMYYENIVQVDKNKRRKLDE